MVRKDEGRNMEERNGKRTRSDEDRETRTSIIAGVNNDTLLPQ
jgi:hypothetical protein